MVHGLTYVRTAGAALPGRQALLADLRARRGAGRADLPAPGGAAPGGDRGVLQGLRRAVPRHRSAPPGASRSRPRRRACAWCLSGVFDQYPEPEDHPRPHGRGPAVLALAHRLGAPPRRQRPIDFRETVHASTSGSRPAATSPRRRCSAAMLEMGVDRIMFSVDYPFVDNPPGMEWMRTCRSAPRTRTRSSRATRRGCSSSSSGGRLIPPSPSSTEKELSRRKRLSVRRSVRPALSEAAGFQPAESVLAESLDRAPKAT